MNNHSVFITDERSPDYNANPVYFQKIADWAMVNLPSYVGFNVVDVSDSSLSLDEIAEYWFKSEQDALVFTIKWKT